MIIKLGFLVLFIVNFDAYSDVVDEYVYHEQWSLGYVNGYGNTVFTSVNNSYKWDFPSLIPCYLGPDPNYQLVNRSIFERSIVCKDRKIGTLRCRANQRKTKCSKKIGDYGLNIIINRYPTMRKRRADNYREEIDNNIPY